MARRRAILTTSTPGGLGVCPINGRFYVVRVVWLAMMRGRARGVPRNEKYCGRGYLTEPDISPETK